MRPLAAFTFALLALGCGATTGQQTPEMTAADLTPTTATPVVVPAVAPPSTVVAQSDDAEALCARWGEGAACDAVRAAFTGETTTTMDGCGVYHLGLAFADDAELAALDAVHKTAIEGVTGIIVATAGFNAVAAVCGALRGAKAIVCASLREEADRLGVTLTCDDATQIALLPGYEDYTDSYDIGYEDGLSEGYAKGVEAGAVAAEQCGHLWDGHLTEAYVECSVSIIVDLAP